MSCGHCVSAVTREVSKLKGVRHVDVDLARATVSVETDDPIDAVAFAEAIEEAGYSVGK